MQPQTRLTTFLFTDVEGSSRLWEEDPERMRPALARHDALIRSAVESRRGSVVKMTGDGVCAAFHDPLEAVAATLDLLLALAAPEATCGVPLRVRCGIHLGIVELRDDDYFGNAINRAARIMSAAHGGQALVSQAVADLVYDRMPQPASLRDLGSVRLRDLAHPEHVHQLLHPGLPRDFPPLRSLLATPNNLPQQVTSFVGREHELARVAALLERMRLVTLHGTGGIGKTRLSLQAAANMLDDYPDGVWLVELAPLTDGRRVVQAVATTLGVKEQPGRPVLEALLKHVEDLRLLIVLDNCEHLIDACAALASDLMRSSKRLRILATSREPLRIDGESVYSLPALAVPDRDAGAEPTRLSRFESVRLFSERAVSALPSFGLTDANAAPVIDICRKLDGMPLAIELAAARVRALSVENIASRLSDRFSLLTGGSRTALPRQQTLRALIDWSYELLSGKERALLWRLAVFSGGWTLDAAEAVGGGGGGGQVGQREVVDLLVDLADKSLVVMDADRQRYRLPETIRQYAQERLDQSGEASQVRSRHLAFYLGIAEQARPLLAGPEQAHWLARLDLERENLIDAHAWCDHAQDGADAGFRLVHALKPYWSNRGQPSAGYRTTRDALARPGAQGRTQGRAQTLFHAGQLGFMMGRHAEAQRHLEESLAIAREIGDRARIARVLQPLGGLVLAQGDLPVAQGHLEEALALARELGNKREFAAALNALAQLYRMEQDFDRADPLYEQALALGRELGDGEIVAIGLLNLAMVAIGRGESARAPAMLQEVLDIAEAIGSKPAGQSALEVCSGLATLARQWERAARFYGMAEAESVRTGIRRDAADDAFLKPLVAKTADAIGPDAFDAAQKAGRTLPYDAALTDARAWLQAQA